MENKKPETEGMKSTKQQLLRNPDIQPTNDVVAKALGEANIAYMQFVNELANRDIQIGWRYYNDGKAWLAKGLYICKGIRGGRNETTVFWISIWESSFKVTLYIPEKSRLDVLSLPIDDEVKSMIVYSKQMGKLKYFPLVFDLCSNEKFETIYTLVDFKKRSQ
jgi:hypothetical protein